MSIIDADPEHACRESQAGECYEYEDHNRVSDGRPFGINFRLVVALTMNFGIWVLIIWLFWGR